MVMFVTITRWTPETARALQERYMTVVKGTAPKAVLDAFAKFKIITEVTSLPSNIAVMVYELADKDFVEANNAAIYLQDVCTQETFPVITIEDWVQVTEAVPLAKIPKPEPWYSAK